MLDAVRRALRGSSLVHRYRFIGVSAPYALFRRWVKVRPGRILFLSDSRSDFTGNFAFLKAELDRQAPDADVIGVFKKRLRAWRSPADLVRLPWLLATAQAIVLDDFYPLVYPIALRPETRLVQVWHAAGAFKRVGWSRAGLPGGPEPASLAHLNYTDVPVSAEGVRADYAESFRVDISRVRALGVPRTDAFFDDALVQRSADAVRQRYGVPDGTKIALFAPTFRGNGQLTATYDVDLVPWSTLGAQLGDDWAVLVKMHPFVAPLDVQRPGVTGVIDVSRDREITELLMAADVLITDYSSSIFEFALLKRPIVFFCPDLERYTADRDFYHPFPDYVSGPLVTDGAALADAIASATPGPEASAFIERFMGACDGHSSERIVREMLLRPREDKPVPAASVAPGGSPAPTANARWVQPQLAVAWLARHTLAPVYAAFKLLPTQRKVVMISREHATVPADFKDLRRAIHELDPSLRVVTLVRMVPPGFVGKVRYAGHMLVQLYHVATSRVLIVDTYAIVASVLKHKEDLTVIQIWHALGAFKKFGLSILGKQEGRDARLATAMRMHQGYDLVLASSQACRSAYAEAFGVDIERVQVAPLPRVDRILDPQRAAHVRARFDAAHPEIADARVAVFAPTFRLDGTITVDVVELTRALAAHGIHTIVKLHPLMQPPATQGVDFGTGFSTQDLLHVADIFITDYSSALFEAALLGIPTYFLAPDMDEYLASRDFYLDYRKDLPGPITTSVPDLADAIGRGLADAEVSRQFGATWVEVPHDGRGNAPIGTCAEQIAQLIVGRTNAGIIVGAHRPRT